MRAIVLRNRADGVREKVLVEDWPQERAPGEGEIKTRTLFTGITNGTERNQLIRGNYSPADERLPAPLGYQSVGEVTEVGAGVTEYAIADVVFTDCTPVEFPLSAVSGNVMRLPDAVDRSQAALFGMASVAMHTVRNAAIEVGERLLIVGAGCVGQLTAQLAALRGARVTICDIVAPRLQLARQIGAAEGVINTNGDGWNQQVEDGSFDVVVDLAGVPGMEDQLIRAATHRGRVLFIAGRFKVEYTFGLGQGREITIKQNSHFDQNDLRQTCRLVERGSLDVGSLVTEIAPCADAARVYDTLRDRPEAFMGLVFRW